MLVFIGFGGAEEDRTPDLRIANAMLSQLSYGPNKRLILPAALLTGQLLIYLVEVGLMNAC